MNFVRDTWYAAIWGNDLGRELVGRVFLNEPVVLYRKEDGTPRALADRCPHRLAPLSMGNLKGDDVECRYHGLRFNCEGTCIDNPLGDGFIPKAAKVKQYPIYELWGMVWIWMGDSELADPSLIPDYHWMTDTQNYTAIHGYLHYKANYRLVVDNLSDLSHASFVHADTLEPREMATKPFRISLEDGAVWTRLFYAEMEVPRFFSLIEGLPEKMDHWLEMRCHPPCSLLTIYGVTECGKSREEGLNTFNPNMVTPETHTTSHYFWGSARTFMLDDQALTEKLGPLAQMAFEQEDRPMIEGQARVLDVLGKTDISDEGLQPVLLPTDSASGRVRRITERMIKEENKELQRKVDVLGISQ